MTETAVRSHVKVNIGPWLSALDRWRQRIDAAISRNFQALRECDDCGRRLVSCGCSAGEG